MTIPLFPESQRRPRGRALLAARTAVTLARGLSWFSPRTIARVLTVLGTNTLPVAKGEALKARLAVCAVSTRCAGNGCLQRSIAVFILCRISGKAPNWHTGFVSPPFVAHAWVEVDGEPVGEIAQISDYTTILAVRLH